MSRRTLSLTLVGSLLAASSVAAWYQTRPANSGPLPPLIERPEAALEVLYARPFLLDAPYTNSFRLEQPDVTAGWLLVLRVDPEVALPRETLEPVLFVGEQTAQRWNSAQPDGRLVVTVPAALDQNGLPADDWMHTPIWYGSAELPERIDAPRIQLELEQALASGLAAPPSATLQSARAEGGELLRCKSIDALLPSIADLIERYSPAEDELVRGLRVPVGR